MNPIRWIATTSLSAISLLPNVCTASALYQPNLPGQSLAGGYPDVRLGKNRYRVTFNDDSFTSRGRVEGFMFYRAAELGPTIERRKPNP